MRAAAVHSSLILQRATAPFMLVLKEAEHCIALVISDPTIMSADVLSRNATSLQLPFNIFICFKILTDIFFVLTRRMYVCLYV